MFTALVACKELSRSSLKRGEARKIFGDGTSGGAPMYSSVRVQASRCGGILERSPRYASLQDHHWKTIVNMTRRAESALESFADTNVLRQLSAAKELVDFKTLSSPNNSQHCVKYFGALAFGRNVFLRCHTDEDFTLSVTQIYLKGRDSYSPNRSQSRTPTQTNPTATTCPMRRCNRNTCCLHKPYSRTCLRGPRSE